MQTLARPVLYTCLSLFFVRVVAQLEVLLLAPSYLPEMAAWYSGLLPYPLLLPIQILLLMGMSVLAARSRSAKPLRHVRLWRTLAQLYFAAMAVRLIACVAIHGSEFYLHGAIPIAFHWVLALFAISYINLAEGRVAGGPHSCPARCRVRNSPARRSSGRPRHTARPAAASN